MTADSNPPRRPDDLTVVAEWAAANAGPGSPVQAAARRLLDGVRRCPQHAGLSGVHVDCHNCDTTVWGHHQEAADA